MTFIWFTNTTPYFLFVIFQIAPATRVKYLLSQHPDPSQNHLDQERSFCLITSGQMLEMVITPIQESLQLPKVAYIKYRVLSCHRLGSSYMSICSRTINKLYLFMLAQGMLQGQSTLCLNYRKEKLFLWSIIIIPRPYTVIAVFTVYFQVFYYLNKRLFYTI